MQLQWQLDHCPAPATAEDSPLSPLANMLSTTGIIQASLPAVCLFSVNFMESSLHGIVCQPLHSRSYLLNFNLKNIRCKFLGIKYQFSIWTAKYVSEELVTCKVVGTEAI